MKRISTMVMSIALMFCVGIAAQAGPVTKLHQKVDKSTQPRIIITTDLEVDDMNGVILSLMYADNYDLAGIVWTAGMYHFSGDGGLHTLEQITPHYRCNAQHCEHTVEHAGQLTEYRPVDPTWLDQIMACYESDYKFLSKNNPNYPSPEYIRSITKVGNIEFESDYRFETEGSKWIEQCIMDNDMRPLYIQHWGGINTTVRALYSIYEDYHDTDQWEEVLAKVVAKVRLSGSGEDYCRADSKIDEMFPGLQDGRYAGFGGYGQFFSAANASPDLLPYYQSDYLCDAFKFDHGKLMEKFWLMGEGRAVFGEPLIYNYGLITYMDWATSAELGWGPATLAGRTRVDFDPYDWMCCQFGCASYIQIGLRNDVTNRNNHFTQILFDELAARADWAICDFKDCNHAPIVSADQLDFSVKAGKTVDLAGSAVDPDGDSMNMKWWVPANSCTYMNGKAEGLAVSSETGLTTQFTVPKDAKAGDKFVINFEVQDVAERPMTRFAQYVITVTK